MSCDFYYKLEIEKSDGTHIKFGPERYNWIMDALEGVFYLSKNTELDNFGVPLFLCVIECFDGKGTITKKCRVR